MNVHVVSTSSLISTYYSLSCIFKKYYCTTGTYRFVTGTHLLARIGLYYWHASVCITGTHRFVLVHRFVLLVRIGLYYWYTSVCITGTHRFVLLVHIGLYYWYASVCITGTHRFVLLARIGLYYWHVSVCTTGTYRFLLLVLIEIIWLLIYNIMTKCVSPLDQEFLTMCHLPNIHFKFKLTR